MTTCNYKDCACNRPVCKKCGLPVSRSAAPDAPEKHGQPDTYIGQEKLQERIVKNYEELKVDHRALLALAGKMRELLERNGLTAENCAAIREFDALEVK